MNLLILAYESMNRKTQIHPVQEMHLWGRRCSELQTE